MAIVPQVTSLVDFDTSIFAEHYQQGQRWLLFEQRDQASPLSDEDIVATFKSFTHTGLFDAEQEQSLRGALGAYLGTIHAGVLSPATGLLRPGVTTLAALCNRDAVHGYHAGQEWFFVDAEPHERRYSESRLIERLRESVLEMAHWQDQDPTWFFAIGCLLGELSGQLFPMNAQEQQVYIPPAAPAARGCPPEVQGRSEASCAIGNAPSCLVAGRENMRGTGAVPACSL